MTDRTRYRPAEARRMQRRERAIRLRLAGATYEQIAQQLGVSPDTVARDITAGLRDTLRDGAEQMLAEQKAMTGALKERLFAAGMQGDQDAIDRLIKLMRHEAQLFGLNAPARVRVEAQVTEDPGQLAAKLMLKHGLTPPAALDPGARAVDGPPLTTGPAVDAGVPPEVIDADTEPDDDWVTGTG